jgi:protein-tyrosine kinase
MMATGTRQERRRQAPPNEQRRNHRHNTSAIDEDRDAESNTPEGALPAVAVEPETDSSILRYRDIPPELADAVREIINRYELRTRERVPKSIAVTSAMRGEGVTTVSQALATLIAQEIGSFVCWVDCQWLAGEADPARPSDRPNLLEILADQSQIMSAFRSSPELPQLVTLSPGPVPESKRNIIVRSPEFEHLLGVLAEEFDHVVFDIPPVLANANALALLRRADASVLVVRHRATLLHHVQRALDVTQPVPNLAVLLNRYRTRIPGFIRRLLRG